MFTNEFFLTLFPGQSPIYRQPLFPPHWIVRALSSCLGFATLLLIAGCNCGSDNSHSISLSTSKLALTPGQSGQVTATLIRRGDGASVPASWNVTLEKNADFIESYQFQPTSASPSVTISFVTKNALKPDKQIFIEREQDLIFMVTASPVGASDLVYDNDFEVTFDLPGIFSSDSSSSTSRSGPSRVTFQRDFEVRDAPSDWDYQFNASSNARFFGLLATGTDGHNCVGLAPAPPKAAAATITKLGPKKSRISIEQDIGDFPVFDAVGHCRWDFDHFSSVVVVSLYVSAAAQQSPNSVLKYSEESAAAP